MWRGACGCCSRHGLVEPLSTTTTRRRGLHLPTPPPTTTTTDDHHHTNTIKTPPHQNQTKNSLSVARRADVQKELAALEDSLSPLLLKYKAEKERLDTIRRLQNKRQELIVALEMAEQRQDLARIAGMRVLLC